MPTKPLRIGRTLHAVQAAELQLFVQANAWDAKQNKWVYGKALHAEWIFSVTVDERSGEDGALAPSLHIAAHGMETLPPLSQITRHTVADPENCCSEAWYGNDAPQLENNRLIIGPWLRDGRVQVRWSAVFDNWFVKPRRRSRLVYDGPVAFTGIVVAVKEDAHAKRFLQAVYPRVRVEELKAKWARWENPGTPQRWHRCTWLPKDRPGATQQRPKRRK